MGQTAFAGRTNIKESKNKKRVNKIIIFKFLNQSILHIDGVKYINFSLFRQEVFLVATVSLYLTLIESDYYGNLASIYIGNC